MNPELAELETGARRLRELHRPGDPLLLVNVWDAETAKRVEAAGGQAVATSSAAMAGGRGGRDDNSAGPLIFETLTAIVAGVAVPVTADLEGGYGLSGTDVVDGLLAAGAVGCNIEDTDHTRGDRLLDPERHAAYLAEIRAAADRRGVAVVLNARIDTFLRHRGHDPTAVLDETIRRAKLYRRAGADCVYPIGLRDADVVRRIVDSVDAPVNANPSAPLAALAQAGAARISFGAGPFLFMMSDFQRRATAAIGGDAAAFA
jgi:2-methylisocitrate lyase-like PEP mutase family enzyme